LPSILILMYHLTRHAPNSYNLNRPHTPIQRMSNISTGPARTSGFGTAFLRPLSFGGAASDAAPGALETTRPLAYRIGYTAGEFHAFLLSCLRGIRSELTLLFHESSTDIKGATRRTSSTEDRYLETQEEIWASIFSVRPRSNRYRRSVAISREAMRSIVIPLPQSITSHIPSQRPSSHGVLPARKTNRRKATNERFATRRILHGNDPSARFIRMRIGREAINQGEGDGGAAAPNGGG
jgi:hypothetical protein